LLLISPPGKNILKRRKTEEVRVLFGLGAQELIIILAIVFLIFGAKKLPEIGSGLGKAIKNFKGGVKSIEDAASEKPPDEAKKEAKDSDGAKSA
jgi:sec-independent protein translocase protein TatA